MKIVDHAGNSITSGRLMRWQPRELPDLYVKVENVSLPTEFAPGTVTVSFRIGIPPMDRSNRDKMCSLKDFVTVFNPEDEAKTEAVITVLNEGGGGG